MKLVRSAGISIASLCKAKQPKKAGDSRKSLIDNNLHYLLRNLLGEVLGKVWKFLV